ncbi:hypothetical protein NDU88_006750 [Pleurodeles waltl]|uniref:C-C motif chemokine n=1 Tax=Pleurodeles waltl TaxID=8319 RepID=A0AAV7WEW8_PLEWA|nr:hypothetical protein NDU88_006750 [Pleurodeles waltl]
MAPQVPLAALLAALLCALPVQGNDNIALDCCLKTSNHPIQLKILWRYEDQNPDQGCPFPAVVFITKADKKLCAPPKLPWVLKRKKQLDNKKKPEQTITIRVRKMRRGRSSLGPIVQGLADSKVDILCFSD